MGQAEQQHLDWLARSYGRPGYSPLSGSDADLIRSAGRLVSQDPGSFLFVEGDQAAAAFLIERGEVEVYRGTGKGRRILHRVGPGAMLGDMAVLENEKHVASARALMSVRAYRFDRDRLLSELAARPSTLLRWLVAGLRQLEDTQRQIVRLMHKTVVEQVAELLVEESVLREEVQLSQTTIANLLGVSRQSVNEALGRLRDEGVVKTGYRAIRVLDRDRLSEFADD